MERLYKKLETYSKSDYYGFHMPGHKRNQSITEDIFPYHLDITEIEGFDDLNHPRGILKDLQEEAAKIFGAEETHFLVNGSTVGILSSILGSTIKGDEILLARNCHKSVYHSMALNELKPTYLYPNNDGEIDKKEVEEALKKRSQVKVVVVTSPTYEGVVSDIKSIAEVVHLSDAVLIVDEAHGAHFGYHPYFPEGSNVKGADIVIHSLHKTLPALTQTALLHMNGKRVKRDLIAYYLQVLQTSSPSYILLSSIDSCISFLKKGKEVFDSYVSNLQLVRRELEALEHLELFTSPLYDRSKLVISVKNTTIKSRKLYRILLDEFHIQTEMIGGTYVLGMTSVGDTKEGFDRLVKALQSIDKRITTALIESEEETKFPRIEQEENTELDLAIMKKKFLLWEKSIGNISAEYAYLYPPGSPIVVPGERITKEVVEYLRQYKKFGFTIEGIKREGEIEVYIDE